MFQQLNFSHERDLNLDELCRRVKVYYPDADFVKLRKAYFFAERSHKGQMRSSGEEYIIHPINVAGILIKLRMDMESIIAGLLHDTVEDCGVLPEEIEKEFSLEIAQIVVGLTKISRIKFKTQEESQAENFRKMVVAMAKDLRVIIVKIADRMHNMITLQYVSKEKQKKIAQDTLDIYIPLASRLGINSVKIELEDLCLKFLHSDIYYNLVEKVTMNKKEKESYIRDTISSLEDKFLEYGVRSDLKGRPKHFYSIYKKMIGRGVEFEQIHDLLAFRIIVNNITECYKTLGIIHSSFIPIPGRFKDYIAIPKVNNYQSLHTIVIGPEAERIEIQIRTHDMNEVAERGIAAHWKYKEGHAVNSKKLAWVQELLEFNQNVESSSEFMAHVKNDLDISGEFVFTPNGDVFELRCGSTPLDFAYAVHTEVGHKCVGAKVNGKMVPLKHTLQSGDTVEILTSKNQTPSKDWIGIVKSSKAKSRIKAWLLRTERDRNIGIGKESLSKSLRTFGTSSKNIIKNNLFEKPMEVLGLESLDDLYVNLGSGKFSMNKVIELIPGLKEKKNKQKKTREGIDHTLSSKIAKTAKKKSNKENAVIVNGISDLVVRIGKCCGPIPGDEIIGYITRGRGVTIHRNDCSRYDILDMDRRVFVEWNDEFSFNYPVTIRIITYDRPGILSLITKSINNINVNIRSAIAKSLHGKKGSFVFEIEVSDYSELLKTINGIEAISEVISVSRV